MSARPVKVLPASLIDTAEELLAFVESVLTAEDWDYDDWKYRAINLIRKAKGE